MTDASMPSIEICDRARASRDARFDGLFFIAVRSTGIYCRPVCPSPTAKRSNVIYYPTAAAAVAAGYRPCLRCRPELAPEIRMHGNEDAMRRALALIAEGALQEGTMDTLASQVALSARQLRRLFLVNIGASPIAVHATRRLLLAKQLLTETSLPVTQVALAAGFKSVRRFNAAFRETCRIAPIVLRKSGLKQRRSGAPDDVLALRLAYRPPLDFASMLAFLAQRAIPGIERISSSSYESAIGPADNSVWIRVTAEPKKPELRLQISATDPRAIPHIVRRVRRLFDLDADMRAAHSVLCADPYLAPIIRRNPGLRVPGAWDGFEVLLHAILGEQKDARVATDLVQRLVESYGERRDPAIAGLDRVFPRPDRLLSESLEAIGMSGSQAATIRAVAAASLDGRLNFNVGQRLDQFVGCVTAIRGVTRWAAHYVAMRALNQPDAFPAKDSSHQTEFRSQAWRPWRAYAAILLWHERCEVHALPE